ncbi:hypothetical protein [Endozoicomonas atrinae]|uniref:hypothetical protein n=2 Tax=Endozoicomonas atrinae TaxID=1333660 RepID=UPI003B00CEAD
MSIFAHYLQRLPVLYMANRRDFFKAGALLATAGLATAAGGLSASPSIVQKAPEPASKERKPKYCFLPY